MAYWRFNPLRGRSPAEIIRQHQVEVVDRVSIRCGAAAPQKSRRGPQKAQGQTVSIRCGAAAPQKWKPCRRQSARSRFNPLRGRSPAEMAMWSGAVIINPFQSAAGPQPRRNPRHPRTLRIPRSFNPLRGRSPAEISRGPKRLATNMFQSAAGPQPRRNAAAANSSRWAECFNPLRGRSPAEMYDADQFTATDIVSIRCGAAAPQKSRPGAAYQPQAAVSIRCGAAAPQK